MHIESGAVGRILNHSDCAAADSERPQGSCSVEGA